MKKELAKFRDEINQALKDVRGDLNNTIGRVEEAGQRVAELQECSTDLENAFRQMKQAQESLQT